MRLAVIDLGSNSARLGIYTCENGLKEIFRKRETVRLAEGLETDNMLKKEPMERTLKAFLEFSLIIKEQKADRVEAIATESLRRAENSSFFVNLVKEATGIEIKIINGKDEALFASLAACSVCKEESFYFVDTGGGSVEAGLVEKGELKEFVSTPYGCVVLTEQFEPDKKGVEALNAFLYDEFKKFSWIKKPYPFVVLGGSVKELARLSLNTDSDREIDGKTIPDTKVSEIFEKIYNTKVCERAKKLGIEDRRADIITAGLCPTLALLKITGSDTLVFCTKSVRDGVAEAIFNGKSI